MHTKNHICRIPDIPACRHASIVSTERDLGPSVPTILVSNGIELCKALQTALTQKSSNMKNPIYEWALLLASHPSIQVSVLFYFILHYYSNNWSKGKIRMECKYSTPFMDKKIKGNSLRISQ